MDRKKHQINNESNKTNKKSTSSDKTNTEEDVEQSPSHRSFGFEIDHTNHLGHQFSNWKKGLLEEAGESPLKPLVNEVEKRRKLADEKIDMVDKLLQIMSDAEKDYDSSFKEFLRKIETPSDDMESLTTSLDLFMESSSGLLEVFENAKDFVEKP